MSDYPVEPGDVVAGLEPGELVEVQRVAPFGSKVLVEGIGASSRQQIRRPLSIEELARLSKIRGASRSFDGDPQVFLLGAEAERIRIAHQFDPLFAVNSSIVDPLPHQVEAVYRYLLPLPRIRFLLADDTGAGKTEPSRDFRRLHKLRGWSNGKTNTGSGGGDQPRPSQPEFHQLRGLRRSNPTVSRTRTRNIGMSSLAALLQDQGRGTPCSSQRSN